jgi:hypothetical protein
MNSVDGTSAPIGAGPCTQALLRTIVFAAIFANCGALVLKKPTNLDATVSRPLQMKFESEEE